MKIRCPYCFEKMEPEKAIEGINVNYKCSKNNETIPREFIEKGNIPKTSIGLVGYTGHGKTVYITSLFFLLKELQNKWGDDYYLSCLDDNTSDVMYVRIPKFKKGELPDSTPINFSSPALIFFRNIPYIGDYFVSIYDIGGGVFERSRGITEQGRFIAYCDTVLFIMSIYDSGENWIDRIHQLLNNYHRSAYGDLGIKLSKKQNLIVVLTKADLLIENNVQLTPELSDYLNNTEHNPENIIKNRTEISNRIRKWLISMGCRGFVNMAKDNFKSVEYTIVSATGAAPVGRNLAHNIDQNTPKRVLEPFIYALDKNLGLLKRLWR